MLGKSCCFSPGVHTSDLSDAEQTLIALFRKFDEKWQDSLLATMRNQLALFNQTTVIQGLPVDKREDAAYELVARLFDMQGLEFTTDEEGRPVFDVGELAAVLGVKYPVKEQELREYEPSCLSTESSGLPTARQDK